MESIYGNNLGNVYAYIGQWDSAEHAYREAARIDEEQGNLQGASIIWNALAIVYQNAGKPDEAEKWFRKAIDVTREMNDLQRLAGMLSNLAYLLHNYTFRLAETRAIAEESLAIKKSLHPGVAEIWKTYHLMAEIALKENNIDQAHGYRQLAVEYLIKYGRR